MRTKTLTRDSSWRRVHRAADENRERLRRALLMAVRAGREAMNAESFMRAYEQSPLEALRTFNEVVGAMSAVLRRTLPTILFDTLVEGAESSLSSNGRLLLLKRQQRRLGFAFNKTNPVARAWAERESAKQVADITHETRAALQSVVTRAFDEGIPPRTLARFIRPMIGVTQAQADKIFDRYERDVREDGEEVALRLARDRQDSLTKQRALSIARTETLAAANEGQRELWEQAQDEGLISRTALRVWIYSPIGKECEICGPLDGETASVNGSYEHPETGEMFSGPPAHPNCRCAQGLES